MNVDLHRVLARKQERECAKADDFAFKARARAFSRFGEWLRGRRVDIDPKALARRVATAGDETIFEEMLVAHGGDHRTWSRAFDRAQATAELRVELGDPSPHRLA